jgi:hypothetical protein
LPCWILLDAVLTALTIARTQPVETAVAYAVERDWLRAAGNPVHSITITAKGMAMFRRAGPRKRKARSAEAAGL